jgi:hypothetical protein
VTVQTTETVLYFFVPYFYRLWNVQNLELATMFSGIKPQDIQMAIELLKIMTRVLFIAFEVVLII